MAKKKEIPSKLDVLCSAFSDNIVPDFGMSEKECFKKYGIVSYDRAKQLQHDGYDGKCTLFYIDGNPMTQEEIHEFSQIFDPYDVVIAPAIFEVSEWLKQCPSENKT